MAGPFNATTSRGAPTQTSLDGERLYEHIRDALGRAPSLANAPERLINEAGIAWTNTHGWNYLRRQARTIGLNKDQAVYGLGRDFRELESIVDPQFPAWEPDLMVRAEFEIYKHRTITGTDTWWSGTIYDDAIGEIAQKVLEVYPAPRADRDIHLVFTGGWTPIDRLDDAIVLPARLEPAFIEWVRHYAEGRERHADMDIHLLKFKQSAIFQDAAQSEGSELPYLLPGLSNAGQRFFNRTRGRDLVWGPWGPRLRRPFGRG